MSKVETVIALPIRQMVNPLQLMIGGIIAVSGVALMVVQGASLI